MPGLTLNTSSAARAPTQPPRQTPTASANANPSTSENTQDPARPSSPPRPTYSPITPPLNPVALPPRPTYTHTSQQDQVGIAPPPPEPIDFDSNPDVLALKSAISILQLQRRKAAADMAHLSRVKTAALAEPEAFVHDLTTGRVGMEGDALYGGSSSAAYDDDDDDDDDDEEEEDDGEMEDTQSSSAAAGHPAPSTTSYASSSGNRTLTDSLVAPHSEIKSDPDPDANANANAPEPEPEPPHHHQPQPNPQSRPWTRLPKPQNVVRCPPINWAQYAVVGESLDKLHSEQISRPAQGVPAAVGPDGRYEFKGEQPGRQEKLVGVAAPYAPGKDRIERKPKGPKR